MNFNSSPVFIATAENNEQMKEQLAKEYSNENCRFSKEDINCCGCFSEEAHNSKMCGSCIIKNCAEGKKVKNCAYCSEYPCNHIDTYVREGTENRKRLDSLSKS